MGIVLLRNKSMLDHGIFFDAHVGGMYICSINSTVVSCIINL